MPQSQRESLAPTKSPIPKRSVVIAGHKTSVSLEDAFWEALKEIAGSRDSNLSSLVAAIDADRQHCNLSSAVRIFILGVYRGQTPRHASEAQEQLVG
jgi:predicted DNA-binding ribbon-helix-helix protein